MSTGRRAYDLVRAYVGREWERIQGVEEASARTELAEALEAPAPRPSTPPPPSEDRTAHARRLLGVGPKADFETVRKAFERLNRRCEPENFPEGSPESAQAADIRKKVHWAYAVLTEGMDLTERRFRTLEID